MNIIIKKNITIIYISIITFMLFIYAILSRLIPIYFFWESLSLSWLLFLGGLCFFFINKIKNRIKKDISAIGYKIGLGFIFFILLIQSLLFISIMNSDALIITKNYLKNSEEISNEVGTIKNISVIPSGTIHIKKKNNIRSGDATINLIIKGNKKYIKLKVFLQKRNNSDWYITKIQ